jgi:[protein-PII] uridylyltransferase
VVRARQAHEGRGIQVMVFSHDQTDLFARICGYFDRQSYTIMDAKIHTTRDGHVLDSFELLNEQQGVEVREAMGLIEAGLSHELTHLAPLRAPVVGRVSRRVRSFPMRPHVALSPDEKGQHWLLTVSASDRNGLLYSITHTLASHKISVELAKIMTLGERVEDVFLISGEALASSERRIELETVLLQALED